jgi:hypothetical protein
MKKKIRIIREEAEETFQLTVSDLKRIINEELGRLDEQANNPNAVKAVQAALNMLGYPQVHIGRPLAVDGDYGRRTEDMVEDFQAAAGLQDDGAVGPATAAELQRELQKMVSSAAIGDPETGDVDDDSMRIPGDKSTGRKPVQRIKSPEEFVGSQEVVDKIEAAANDKSRFKDPVMAAATLKKFADQGDRELLSALRDLAERGGKRVQQRSMQIARDLTDILAKTRPENREKQKQSFLNQLKSDASVMAQRLQIPSFRPRTKALDIPGPVAESINEQLEPSGDSEYTLDVVNTLLDMIQDEKMVLRRRRRRVSEQTTAPGDTDPGDEETSKLPPGLKLIEPHVKLSSASRLSLTRKETPQWTREEGMVFISQDKSSHGEHQFAQDPYTYDSDGDDYIVISGPRPGAIGKKIRKDATSPRMKRAHALLDKRLGKEVAIGKPDPGEPETKDAKDAEGAEEITKKDEKQIKDVATATYGAIKKAVDEVRPIAEEIDSAIEGITTDADLYIIWRQVKKSITRDDDSLFKTRLLNGLYAADYAGLASWAMPVAIGAAAALIAAATVASGGALLPALGGVLAGLGSGAGISMAAVGAGLTTLSGAAAATSAASFSAAGAILFRDYLSDKLEDDPETAKALAAIGDLSLPDEAYGEVDFTTGKPAELAMEAVRDVMTGIARGEITNKQDALNKLEAPLKAEEVLDIVEKG